MSSYKPSFLQRFRLENLRISKALFLKCKHCLQKNIHFSLVFLISFTLVIFCILEKMDKFLSTNHLTLEIFFYIFLLLKFSSKNLYVVEASYWKILSAKSLRWLNFHQENLILLKCALGYVHVGEVCLIKSSLWFTLVKFYEGNFHMQNISLENLYIRRVSCLYWRSFIYKMLTFRIYLQKIFTLVKFSSKNLYIDDIFFRKSLLQ